MLNKRIASLLVSGMVMVSMVGCQSSKEQQLEQRVQQLEQQLEEKEEKDAENVTAGEYLEQHKGDASAEIDTTKTGKTRADGRKARYTANGVFVGYFTDAEVKQLNKGIAEAIDKELKKQQSTTKQDDNTNSDVDDRAEYEKEYQPKDHTGEDEDYWKTDGDLPYTEPAPEEQDTTTEENNNNYVEQEQQEPEQDYNDYEKPNKDAVEFKREQNKKQAEQHLNNVTKYTNQSVGNELAEPSNNVEE